MVLAGVAAGWSTRLAVAEPGSKARSPPVEQGVVQIIVFWSTRKKTHWSTRFRLQVAVVGPPVCHAFNDIGDLSKEELTYGQLA